MLLNTERVSGYFLSLDVLPNIYESLEVAEGFLSPHEQLHQMMLRRLHGRRLSFTPVFIYGYGYINIPTIPCFDLIDIVGATSLGADTQPDGLYCSVIDIPEGELTINWYHRSLSIRFKEGVLHPDGLSKMFDADRGLYMSEIRLIKPLDVRVLDGGVDVLLSLDVSEQDVSEETTMGSMGSYVHFNRIENGSVVFNNTFDILPENPVMLSTVSEITGVSANTLSELRHGKKHTGNLSVRTAMLLTQYGDIRFLDRFLLDALDEQRVGLECDVIVEMKDSGQYTMCFDTESEMIDLIESIYSDAGNPNVMLKDTYYTFNFDKVFYDYTLICKEDISRVYGKVSHK